MSEESDSESKLQDAKETLFAILDVLPSPIEDTDEFKNLKQKELCDSLKYWVDQTKTFFGEPVQVEIVHNLREEGVDIVIKLLKSKLQFGVQVKTYGDIQERHFSDKVHSQINRSRKYGLTKFLIAFAGDLTNKSQNQKVSGVISEIHQTIDDHYVLVLSPANLLTIVNVYKNKDNPSQFINLNIERAITLAKGIGRALSNKNREAKVSINFNYRLEKGTDEGFRISLKYALNKGEYGLLDKIDKMQNAKEPIVISKDQIKEFVVTDKGKPVFIGSDSDIVIEPEKRIAGIIFQAISKSGEIMDSTDEIKFEVSVDDKKFTWHTFDESEPCRFTIIYNQGENAANLKFTLDYFRGDVDRLLKRLDFLNALKQASTLRLVDTIKSKTIAEIEQKGLPPISQLLYDTVKSLALIQKKTGHIFSLPKELNILSKEELNNIFQVASIIETGTVRYKKMNSTVTFPRLQALSLLDEFIKKNELKDLSYRYEMMPAKVLGIDIKLGPAKLVAPVVKVSGDAKKLYNDLAHSEIDSVDIELELVDPELHFDWFRRENVKVNRVVKDTINQNPSVFDRLSNI